MIERALFSLDLDSLFPVEGSLSQDFLHNISIPSFIDESETGEPDALFATNDSLYVYRFKDNDTYRHTFPSYNTSTNSWKQVFISGGEFDMIASGGQGVSDPISGLSFYFGRSSVLGGMLRLNVSNPDDVTWTTQTTEFSGSEDNSVPQYSEGVFVYLPVGKAGALLLFGGRGVSI